jgi:hypothetical protein
VALNANLLEVNSACSPEPITISLSGDLAVRLYSDCRPSCLETSKLQKGLVLMQNGEELIEEGVGFGVPIAKYRDKTYFPSTAQVSARKNAEGYLLTKIFILDAISKKSWQNRPIDDMFYSRLRKGFAKLYLTHKQLSPLFNKIMELRDSAQVKTEFVRVKPRGKVTVTYGTASGAIFVTADFSDLKPDGCEELLVLNEQGSSVFGEYFDAEGVRLAGSKIGGWDTIKAKSATLHSPGRGIAFTLERVGGAILFRGWENTKNRFSWAGLSYSLCPEQKTFNYTIKLGCRNQGSAQPT